MKQKTMVGSRVLSFLLLRIYHFSKDLQILDFCLQAQELWFNGRVLSLSTRMICGLLEYGYEFV